MSRHAPNPRVPAAHLDQRRRNAGFEGTVPSGRAWTRYEYEPRREGPLLEKWIVHGMTHKWSGGAEGQTFTDPAGPEATEEMLRFFASHPRRN
jgi:poly(3-hydroxybutyrate) depolymerase